MGYKNMLSNELYFRGIKSPHNIVYSVDMLRLKTYITYFDFKELEFFLNTYHKAKIKKFWCSDRIQCFHYNYLIEIEEGKTFYFGFMHNNEHVSYDSNYKKYNFTIEFNPNKIKDNSILRYILSGFGNWLLRSCDIAMDIQVSILDIVFDIGNRRKFHTISYGGDNISYSVGQGNGRYKIYNKKKESNLEIVGNLTRVELSLEYEDFPLMEILRFNVESGLLPEVFLNQYVVSLSSDVNKDKTLSALLFAVQQGFPLKELSRRYREKIKNLLEGGSRIRFEKKYVIDAFRQCIFGYFIGTKQVFM